MKVEVIKADPKPPIEKVILELSFDEALIIAALSYGNESCVNGGRSKTLRLSRNPAHYGHPTIFEQMPPEIRSELMNRYESL